MTNSNSFFRKGIHFGTHQRQLLNYYKDLVVPLEVNKIGLAVFRNSTLRFSKGNGERGVSTIAISSGEIPIFWQKESDGVLVSSSLWQGVDLKDDLARFQIIAKTPYPNYTEKWVESKMEMHIQN